MATTPYKAYDIKQNDDRGGNGNSSSSVVYQTYQSANTQYITPVLDFKIVASEQTGMAQLFLIPNGKLKTVLDGVLRDGQLESDIIVADGMDISSDQLNPMYEMVTTVPLFSHEAGQTIARDSKLIAYLHFESDGVQGLRLIAITLTSNYTSPIQGNGHFPSSIHLLTYPLGHLIQ